MRTKNEKFLLVILIAIVLAGGNYYGYRWLSQKQAGLQLTYAQLKADKADAEVDLQQEAVMTQYRGWIHDHEPALGEEGDTRAQVLQDVLKGARANKLEILEQSLKDTQHGPAGAQINVEVKVKGPMEGLCHWLADLQKPESFYAVPQFSLKADQDLKSMVCTLQVARYFKEGTDK